MMGLVNPTPVPPRQNVLGEGLREKISFRIDNPYTENKPHLAVGFVYVAWFLTGSGGVGAAGLFGFVDGDGLQRCPLAGCGDGGGEFFVEDHGDVLDARVDAGG